MPVLESQYDTIMYCASTFVDTIGTVVYVYKDKNFNTLASYDGKDSTKKVKKLSYSEYSKLYVNDASIVQRQYNIPVDIVLAQGHHESNGGASHLAVFNKNHFGKKCFEKNCKPGHCSNYTDDSHKDFFYKYGDVQESFAHYGKFLQSSRYKWMWSNQTLTYNTYVSTLKKWRNDHPTYNHIKRPITRLTWVKLTRPQKIAYGLWASGYATDVKYPQKLISKMCSKRVVVAATPQKKNYITTVSSGALSQRYSAKNH